MHSIPSAINSGVLNPSVMLCFSNTTIQDSKGNPRIELSKCEYVHHRHFHHYCESILFSYMGASPLEARVSADTIGPREGSVPSSSYTR